MQNLFIEKNLLKVILCLNFILNYYQIFHFLDIAHSKGISFHRLDGVDKQGRRCWTSLTGNLSTRLRESFLEKSSSESLPRLEKIYLIGDRQQLIQPTQEQVYFLLLLFFIF